MAAIVLALHFTWEMAQCGRFAGTLGFGRRAVGCGFQRRSGYVDHTASPEASPMDLVKRIYQLLTTRAARSALVGRVRDRKSPDAGRFTRSDVARLVDAAWRRYDGAVPGLPAQPTAGSTMNVRLACFTFSFFEELLAGGTDREYAVELVADASWKVYQAWARITSAAARLARGTSSALAFAASQKSDNGRGLVRLRFPFNAPGYAIETVPVDAGTGFNVVHCPVSSYFRARGAADLCLASWCNLDYSLSELTHQTLVRTKTLVQGDAHCDFRILPIVGA